MTKREPRHILSLDDAMAEARRLAETKTDVEIKCIRGDRFIVYAVKKERVKRAPKGD